MEWHYRCRATLTQLVGGAVISEREDSWHNSQHVGYLHAKIINLKLTRPAVVMENVSCRQKLYGNQLADQH